jgi:hypothetical protein
MFKESILTVLLLAPGALEKNGEVLLLWLNGAPGSEAMTDRKGS